ncbi:DNA polymerase beta superfamily protein [Aquibacillus rhizosphaerae]|uniref:Nucleotidyltransferase domain-containing protein n=1 Tax=Aquibacillus rhizosphaerae TaxID=3051431 RepID=A0ABT7L4W6_9BACI|nr:nucleotidyltransferase domain-containing protein [Aquibacillus sp. LR5S19]MDL4839631.1 nucleotidyltransferase domain-containing protein [Aquibacillus sp. LR5S19]
MLKLDFGGIIIKNTQFLNILQENTIYHIISGSTAYGLATEKSDIDEKAFVILPIEYILQLDKDWETETFHSPDIEFHSLKKALLLLRAQNPTMLETLFVLDSFIIKQTEYGKKLRDNRHLFLSKQCFHTFGGYARDQLMLIKNGLKRTSKQDYNSHLENTLNTMHTEKKSKYPLLEKGELKINQVYRNNLGKVNVDYTVNFNNIPITQLNSVVSELSGTIKNSNKRNNRDRKPTDKLFKHAMHLIRLLLMGIELLESGNLTVYREKNRDFLLSVRNQNFTWQEIFDITDDLFIQLASAKTNSQLPEKVNSNQIDKLYLDIARDYYDNNTI